MCTWGFLLCEQDGAAMEDGPASALTSPLGARPWQGPQDRRGCGSTSLSRRVSVSLS